MTILENYEIEEICEKMTKKDCRELLGYIMELVEVMLDVIDKLFDMGNIDEKIKNEIKEELENE